MITELKPAGIILPQSRGMYLNATDAQRASKFQLLCLQYLSSSSGIFGKDLNLEYFEQLKNSLAQFKTEFMR